jgi:XTP/dITP diphosphohydrolase
MVDDLVTVGVYRDLPEALLNKAKLDSAGVDSTLLNTEMVRMDWFISNAIGNIRLQVRAEDVEAAQAALMEPRPQLQDFEVAEALMRCPKCLSLDSKQLDWEFERYQCNQCGTIWEDSAGPAESEEDTLVPEQNVPDLLYIASSNRGKLREFTEIAATYEIQVEPLPNLHLLPEPNETGATFEENARIKAVAYSQDVPDAFVIADDSGLEVDALNGAPGVYSARYAATDERDKPSDSDNNYKLLGELAELPNAPRTGRFVCVIALAKNGTIIETFRGEAHGEILASPLGKNGFGYDPLFFVVEANKTFAEMNAEEKALYSHRGAAFRKLLDYLTKQ